MSSEQDNVNTSHNTSDDILAEIHALRLDVTNLHNRVDACEYRLPLSQGQVDPPFLPRQVPTAGISRPDASPAAIGVPRDKPPRTFDVLNAFSEVKDKYSGVKLPADLLFTTPRRSVKSEDASVFQVLSKVAKYCETGLKILTSPTSSPDSDKEPSEDCWTVLHSII